MKLLFKPRPVLSVSETTRR